MEFRVYPTNYLHLLLTPAATSMQIKPFFQFEAEINHTGTGFHPKIMNDISAGLPGMVLVTDYIGFDTSKVGIVTGKFTPTAVGDMFGSVRVTDSGQPANVVVTECALRVKIHEKIDEFWIGNNSITIHENQSNYVISVYARFDDGSFGDISYHPYLKFTSADPSKLGVDAEGRLTGKKKGNTVAVIVEHNGVPKTIDVKIIDPISVKKSILELIHGSGSHVDKRNILLLSEGFADTVDDKQLFEELTTKVIQDELFKSVGLSPYSPYHHLRDEFLVWRAFIGSPEPGVSILNPVLLDGTPIEKEIDHEQHLHGYVQLNDSYFGYGMGGRVSEKNSYNPPLPTGVTVKDMWFLIDDPARTVTRETKRLDNTWDSNIFMYEFLRSLKPVPAISSTSPYKDVYKMWSQETGFRDSTLICVIIKDELRAGTNSRKKMQMGKYVVGSLAINIGKAFGKHKISVKAGTNRIIDHKPAISTFSLYSPDMHDITAMIAHEYAHSMRIGDEYEDIDNRGHAVPAAGKTPALDDDFVNLLDYTRIQHATDPYPSVDMDKIIWNWHLIEIGSLLKADATLNTSKKIMTIKLATGQKAQYAVGDEVFVRHPLMNVDPADLTIGITNLIKIKTINSNSGFDVLTLESTNPINGPFPKGSLLFKPLKNKPGVIQTLILPEVLTALKLRPTPFNLPASQPAKATRNAQQNRDFGDAYEYPGAIPNIPIPYCTGYLTGIYEGGGTYNTRVYRPTGWGMMRKGKPMVAGTIVVSEMSMVNKYIIINYINPALLSKLNAELGDAALRNL